MLDYSITNWLVARVAPNREQYASNSITKHYGCPTYLPKYAGMRHGKPDGREIVLFTSYLFVDTSAHSDQWRFLLQNWGICAILTCAGLPEVIPNSVIMELRSRENTRGLIELPRERWRRGAVLRVCSGLFGGTTGKFDGMAAGKVQLVLDVLGRMLVPENQVEAVAA